ncbi:MAG: DJ-1/PfpI family protein [Marmoricola sp.]|nr:DJ-1/PfpI family protein [Marmoricola sp.]
MDAISGTRVGIVVFDEVEVLDACGPFEVFSVAARVARRTHPEQAAPFRVATVSAGDGREVVARGGLRLVADHTLGDAPGFDVVVVPGGVTTAVETDQRLLAWLRSARTGSELIASVCTGAFVLAEAGLLRGPVTTHWEDVEELARRFPQLDVQEDVRYVDLGDVATSAGVSAGIDLSLEIVSRYAGEELAVATARQMDYPWTRDRRD